MTPSPAQGSERVRPVCPECRGHLEWTEQSIACLQCGAKFEFRDGFADLIVGGRFDDEVDASRSDYETSSNDYLARNYLLPTFRKLLDGIKVPRILSLGCGIGVDVELLAEEGWDISGIDNGNRTTEWPRRRHCERLYLANGMALPFEDGTFDLAYCGCVFPHVGVEGDSNKVKPEYWSARAKIASEMSRVLKPGGSIMVSSPNRLFPLDLFHGRDESHPFPRLNPPTSPFLLSAGDYRKLFGQVGCADFRLLPVNGYWGFLRKQNSWKGRVVTWPVKTVFDLVSQERFGMLRGSPINPWLVMMMNKRA